MLADRLFLNLTKLTIAVAFVVIVLGAYTRLSHAGLGCPDWPGCYGRMLLPADETEILNEAVLYPERPYEQGKAWKEMIHRYVAGALGLLILGLGVMAWSRRNTSGQSVLIPVSLIGLVIFQALLGMWTVTLLLKPIIVMGHLLGGMTILLLLVWVLLSHQAAMKGGNYPGESGRLYPWAIFGLIIVYLQISLGGWTSANYAALICPDLPSCQGQWWPNMNFSEGFKPWRGLGVNYEFGVLDTQARTAVHVSHRIGAVLTLFIVGAKAIRCIQDSNLKIKRTGTVLLLVLLTQFSLGIANILFVLPIAVAVTHNAVASLLLAVMGALLFYTKHSIR